MDLGSDAEMAAALVAAAEIGFSGDRQMQIKQIAGQAIQAPAALTGVFLKALAMLSSKEADVSGGGKS
jgi:hypothetical protein